MARGGVATASASATTVSKRWDFVDNDPEFDEEGQAVRREAIELREQANALSHYAGTLPEECQRRAKWREAVSMYQRAANVVIHNACGRRLSEGDKELATQCWLNSACLALKIDDDESCHRMCDQALDLDAENPHAALFKARVTRRQERFKASDRWLLQAQRWAKERGEEQVLAQAADFLKSSEHHVKAITGVTSDGVPTSGVGSAETGLAPTSPPNPSAWVREGVELLRQRRPAEAKHLLERAVRFLDSDTCGGPIEHNCQREFRALAFDALESLSEAVAQEGNHAEACCHARRAARLLEHTDDKEKPFSEPVIFKREGLLFLSIGHASVASGGDPLPSWRVAVDALRKYEQDPALEGHALLELGAASAAKVMPDAQSNRGRCEGVVLEEALASLSRAVERFRSAQKALAGSAEDPCNASSIQRLGVEGTVLNLARKELRAQTILACLWQAADETEEANTCLQASLHLVGLAPESATPNLATEWAEIVGKWALVATKVGRIQNASEALETQRRLAKVAKNVPLELEALKALAVVRCRLGDEAGAKTIVAAVGDLTPDAERTEVITDLCQYMRLIAPQSSSLRTGKSKALADRDVGSEAAEDALVALSGSARSAAISSQAHDRAMTRATTTSSAMAPQSFCTRWALTGICSALVAGLALGLGIIVQDKA
eukprot:TRINITY_DN3665_c0_g3_i1.p1 TRINITY_DN3665_c0_g3~~TRINITY_DN3665_c0_g3_i1.p1  ORF type:complete len:669 (+),score=109.78 TRINITY_DN3665_c0_g3_i1:92-2098(+)